MKKISIIHQEQNSDCIEILKECIVEEKELKKFQIDEKTLIHKLPEGIINSFLDFISDFKPRHREVLLKEIKEGRLVIECWEDEENDSIRHNSKERRWIDKLASKTNDALKDPEIDECPF
ncbi:hypothetical protein SAMN05444285_14231 [Draconibacterium orientale]|uniref:Uncharacterized protein n=1 Tax=Draconibacterium orientale TaxID=1168034 RepID=X5DKI3_9BACT|nr:hypothetical protein [Draconibacterium orientale]AHW61684.1 hypothetical protein FH5T_06375 [Draconibacterium orientale]SEU09256.1 hypothetical protein SAMN05444285_14231 [Draconibacterium orientale]